MLTFDTLLENTLNNNQFDSQGIKLDINTTDS